MGDREQEEWEESYVIYFPITVYNKEAYLIYIGDFTMPKNELVRLNPDGAHGIVIDGEEHTDEYAWDLTRELYDYGIIDHKIEEDVDEYWCAKNDCWYIQKERI